METLILLAALVQPWPEGVTCEPVHNRLEHDNQGFISGITRYWICSDGKSYKLRYELEKS